MYHDKEKLLEYTKENYPNEDWDSFDIEKCPDVYIVTGSKYDQDKHWDSYSRIIGFTVGVEYKTKEEAEAQIERCKLWPGIIIESLKIKAVKSWLDIEKECIKSSIKRIKEDEKEIFPIYLP